MSDLLNDQIDLLIADAMKSGNEIRKNTLRFIKNEFLKWKTAKENIGKQMSSKDEIQILYKMIKSRMDSIDQYEAAGKKDLANAERAEIDIIKQYLPAQVSNEQIEVAFETVKIDKGWELSKKNMGNYIKAIKDIYPGADGKTISEIVKSKLE